MNKIMVVIIAILIVVAIVQAIQLNALKGKISVSSNTVKSSGGETQEEMMARMHGGQSNTPSQPAMVGGC